MPRELLRQVRLLDPLSQTDRVADVLVEDGVIRAIESTLEGIDAAIRDCAGSVLAPGLIDLYSRSGEPGFEDRETLDSLQAAAAAGGFTQVCLLPTTQPAIDQPAMVSWLHHRQKLHSPKLHCWGALTIGAQGEQMTELAELATSPIIGFADGRPLQNSALLRRLLEYGQAIGKPIGLWCHDRSLAGDGVMREGSEALRLGLPGMPVMAETAPLAALLECVAELPVPIHLMRVSTARSVELIQTAKAQGLPITASTTWLHLLLDVTAIQSTYDPSLHLNPPLGNPTDRAALIQGLRSGVLDAIAIDHSPYTYEEKTVSFAESPSGAIGLELALPLLWQTFVETGAWTGLDLWQFLSIKPAQCLQQHPLNLAVGATEFILFDPQATWQVSSATLQSRSSNTSWLEQTIRGRVLQTWIAEPSLNHR
ncbi:MAG: dihydroorotase [Elainella sp. Prado103]|nr:dihydroorotase [Elainella sp. Prado103]